MFRQIVFAAALAGLIAGLFITVVQSVRVLPLISEAEVYETAALSDTGHHHSHDQAHEAHDGAVAHDHGATAAHDHGDGAWAPEDGLERTAYTLLMNVLTGIGFSLLLGAAFALRGETDAWKGFYWGIAGFVTFTLAPSIGLPPEVPGTAAAPLADRQLWWLGAVLATAAGLALLFLVRRPAWAVAAVGLLVLPHLIGAPQPEVHESLAPESLAHEFVVAALITSFLFWLVLGSLTGFFYKRFSAA